MVVVHLQFHHQVHLTESQLHLNWDYCKRLTLTCLRLAVYILILWANGWVVDCAEDLLELLIGQTDQTVLHSGLWRSIGGYLPMSFSWRHFGQGFGIVVSAALGLWFCMIGCNHWSVILDWHSVGNRDCLPPLCTFLLYSQRLLGYWFGKLLWVESILWSGSREYLTLNHKKESKMTRNVTVHAFMTVNAKSKGC